MNRVKRISIVFVVIMLMICIFINKTYAALNCNVNLSGSKNKVAYNEQFFVDVAISNLQTTNGIIAIGAVVSYDTESLTLVSIEGQNNWSNPFYNSSNGKITSLKNELSTKNENIFKIVFEVKEKGKAKNTAWIEISDFEISDGEGEKNCGGKSINIDIEDKLNTNTENSNQGSNTIQKPNTKPVNSNQNFGNTQATKVSGNNSENIPDENNDVSINNNNVDNNSMESSVEKNDVEENIVNSEGEANNRLNVSENDLEGAKENKTMSKWLLYIISAMTIIAIIVIVFLILKYWKTK